MRPETKEKEKEKVQELKLQTNRQYTVESLLRVAIHKPERLV